MQVTTKAFEKAIRARYRKLDCKMLIKTLEGDFNVGSKELIDGSVTISSNIMSGEFEIGTCYASDLSFSLNNTEGQWNNISFDGATVYPYCGVELSNGEIEYVPMGVFVVDEPGRPYSILQIKASDLTILLDQPLEAVKAAFPITNAALLSAISDYCAVSVDPKVFSMINMNHIIKEIPEGMSCRDAVQEIALMAGASAKLNRKGILEFFTFTRTKFLNGMTWGNLKHSKITWGKEKNDNVLWKDASGYEARSIYGDLKAASVTWGELKELNRTWGLLKGYKWNDEQIDEIRIMPVGSRYNFKQTSELITITGMSYKEHSWGSDLYQYEITKLELVAEDDAEQVLSKVWNIIKDFTYIAFDASYPGDPSVDTGDLVWHQTRDGKSVVSYVTSLKYKHKGKSNLKAEGKSNAASKYRSANSRRLSRIAAETDRVDKRLSAYQAATARLAELLSQGLGVYGPTAVKSQTGGTIYYVHDKPKLEESKELFTLQEGVIAWSDDGGKTWGGGLKASSRLIIRIIEAHKISAEHILVQSGDDLQTFVTNIENGQINLAYEHEKRFGNISVRPEDDYFIRSGKEGKINFSVSDDGFLTANGAKIYGNLFVDSARYGRERNVGKYLDKIDDTAVTANSAATKANKAIDDIKELQRKHTDTLREISNLQSIQERTIRDIGVVANRADGAAITANNAIAGVRTLARTAQTTADTANTAAATAKKAIERFTQPNRNEFGFAATPIETIFVVWDGGKWVLEVKPVGSSAAWSIGLERITYAG